MEEADKVSSSAPDGSRHDIAMNEAAAPADETLRNAENLLEENTTAAQMTEVTSTAQTTEVTTNVTALTTEKTSTAQTAEVISSSQTTEETSAPQTTEITSAPEITEKTGTPQKTEKTSTTQTTEITSAPQTTEITSAPQTTEITSAPEITEKTGTTQISEETSTAQTTEITSITQITEEPSTPQMTEETSASQTTEITSAPQKPEKTSTPQITEETSTPEITEKTSASHLTEETSAPQTTEITSAPQITEKTSTTQTTEETSATQMTEISSTTQITEETSAPQMTLITSAPQMTLITSAPQMTVITSTQHTIEETRASQITEIISASQITEVTSTLQMTEIISTTQIPEETSTPQMTEETITPEKPEEASAPQITEERITTQIPEISSTSQITEETSSPEAAEESFSPPASEEPKTPAEVKPVTPEAEEAPSSSVAAEASSSSSSSSVREESVTAVMESASAPQAPQEEEEAPGSAYTDPESSRQIASEDREQEKEPHTLHPSPSHEPEPPSAPAVAPALLQFPSERCDSPSVVSQVSASLAMDSSGGKDSAAFDLDVLSQSDDDFMFETKKSPFQAFSPVSDGLEEATAARRSVEVSESPSPDLVQDAYDEGHVQSEELRQETDADAPLSLSYAPSDLFSNVNAASDDRPTCLPDILKSSPLNPDKADSGSSEGSPDFSPVHRSADDSPNSPFPANNPFGFDSKILLLKEMAEETEARAVEKAKLEAENNDEQSFTAFDLVKETDVPLKSDGLPKDKGGAEEFSQTPVQTADRFECLGFPGENAREPSDSESPSADSFSPVLDAVPQEASSFGAEQERGAVGEELDAAEEVSEQEVSSEEFEFVERPPRGVAEEFLEMQDSLAFVKASEMPQDEDRSPKPEPQEAADQPPATEDAENQSSYHLLTQASGKPSKAGLESDFQESSPAPVIHPPVDETGAEKTEAEVVVRDLSAAAVLELLYWRDVKSSGLVFGSSLFLLLSLLTCSIISVLSYSALALLSVTIFFRIYRGVLQAIQKSDEGHPFKRYLDQEVTLSKDAVQRHSDVVLSCVNCTLKELRHLFLVEDLVDSLKFAVFLWVLTYVGAWFNGLTLLILGLIGAFSGPIVYEKHQTQIDQFVSTLKSRMKEVMGQIQAKVPGAKKKSE